MRKTKFFIPLTLGLVSTSLLPLVSCQKQEEKETCVITLTVEGKGEVSAKRLEVKPNTKWINVKDKPTLTPNKYWKCDGFYLNGEKVMDETVIRDDCTMTVKFIHDDEQTKIVNFQVVTQEGSVEPTRTYWKGFTFGEIKAAGLLPTPSPIDLYVFNDGWYKDNACQYKISDDTPIEELDYIYVDFIPDPEVFSHIDFELTPQYGQILEGGSIDIHKGTKWANVPHPVIQPVNGYVVDQYLVNGLALTDEYVFNSDDVVTVTFKQSTAQSKFKFELSNDKTYAILVSYAETGDKNIVVPTYYYNNNKSYPVKQIGQTQAGTYPVFNDPTIETVEIPEGPEVIDTEIFSAACTNVASVSFSDSITTFNGSIFAGENKIVTSLHFGKNVSTLFASVINNLPNLGNIVINEYNQTYYDGRAKGGSNCIINVANKSTICGCINSSLPNDLVTVGPSSFKGLRIENINIPASVRTIGISAFEGTSLKTVDFAQRANGDTLEILSYAFKDCSGLKNIWLPDTTTKIVDYAFQNAGLESFHLPRDVTRATMSTSISGAIIDGCKNITSLSADENNPNYESIDGCNIIVDKGVSESQIRMGCKTSTFPIGSEVSVVAGSAFRNCPISEIIIPEGYTRLWANAFYGCSSATKVKLPSTFGNSSIGSTAFSGCTSVNELDLTSYASLDATAISKLWVGTSTSSIFSFNEKGTIIIANGTYDDTHEAWEEKLKKCGITLFDTTHWQIVEAE